MNLLRTISFLFTLLLLVSCIADNNDNCPPQSNCTLHFEYPDFSSHITRIHTSIYDAEGNCHQSLISEGTKANDLRSVDLLLPKGEYTAICWGNAYKNTLISGFGQGNMLSGMSLSHPNYGTAETIPTNDSLYYGKQHFTINADQQVTHTINLKPAHIKIQVHIKGLEAPHTYADVSPVIRINHLKAVYDHNMQLQGDFTDYYPEMEFNNTNKTTTVKAQVLRFSNEDAPNIDILENNRSGPLLYSLDLKKFMTDHNIKIEETNEVNIPIYIEFFENNISIGIDTWDDVIIGT